MYHQVSLGPSDGQLSDLAQGLEVQLSPQHLKGEVPFLLTTAQLKRLQKAAAKGKGCRLRLSAAQVKKIAMSGSGFFSDLLKKGYNLSKPILSKGLDYGIDYAGKLAKNKIKQMAGMEQNGSGFFGDLVRSVGNVGVGALANLAGGSADPSLTLGEPVAVIKPVARRGRPKMNQQGKGFFGNLVRSVGNVGVNALAGLAGGSAAPMPNPYANPNEGLQAALFKKKVSVGSGLKM